MVVILDTIGTVICTGFIVMIAVMTWQVWHEEQ